MGIFWVFSLLQEHPGQHLTGSSCSPQAFFPPNPQLLRLPRNHTLSLTAWKSRWGLVCNASFAGGALQPSVSVLKGGVGRE